MVNKQLKRQKRHFKIRRRISGTSEQPRLTVYRSNKFLYAQIIDDTNSKTLVAASSAIKSGEKENKVEKAKKVGTELAKAALVKKIKKVVFDRGGYKYSGRVKALAEGAREGGLIF
ncbi:MAG: 50S ribosomal protein L18 [Candidatus Curtissbacteria bacterium]|nr:50S ribosomal protein L18 [Candidatus Curtissbacteria bacterium]